MFALGLLPLNEPQNFHGTWGRRSLEGSQANINPDSNPSPPQQGAGVQEAAVKVCTRMEHSPPFPACSHGLSKHLSDLKHQLAQWDVPTSRPASISQGTNRQPAHRSLCRRLVVVLRWSPAGLLGRRPERAKATAHPFVAVSLEHKQASPAFMDKMVKSGASLVAQWLRSHLAMQRTQV